MYELEIDKSTLCATLHLKDSLTIAHAVEIKEALVKALSSANNLVVDHTDVTEYDLSYIQLVISLHKAASIAGKTILFTGIENSLFKSLINESGCPEYSWLTKGVSNLAPEERK